MPKHNRYGLNWISILIGCVVLGFMCSCSTPEVPPAGHPEMERFIHRVEKQPSAYGPVLGIPLNSAIDVPEITSEIAENSIIYVGETHSSYGDHLMQLEFLKNLHRSLGNIAIGMEMFEHTGKVQSALDRYIQGSIDEETFIVESRYFDSWGFNYSLYRDIFNYAREEKIPIIALNADQDIVRKVACNGLEGLSREEELQIPQDMDVTDQAYKERLRVIFENHLIEFPDSCVTTEFEYFYQAQLLWDETMGRSVADFLNTHEEYHMIVFAGTGHLMYGSGIPKRAYRRSKAAYTVILPYPDIPLEKTMADFIMFPQNAEAPQSPGLRIELDSAENRLTITGFIHGSPAKAAGIKIGDRIEALDGKKIADLNSLKAVLAVRKVGDRVRVTVKRGNVLQDYDVDLGTMNTHHSMEP